MKLKTLAVDQGDIIQHEKNSQSKQQLQFPLDRSNGQCQYKNEVNFEKILIDNQESSKIKIINKLCSEKGNVLEKITTIRFGDHIITIKDQYCFEKLGGLIPEIPKKKRVHIFKKPMSMMDEEGQKHSRLTKNLPKNFIKAFINFLEDKKQDSNRQLLECKINLMMSKQKFNNNFIQQIVDDEELEYYFKDFLENHAENWINNSKIRNKNIHLEAINVFLNLKSSRKNQGKVESTNSYSQSSNNNNQSHHNDQQKQQQSQNQNESQNFESANIHFGSIGEKDSILANQSQNYCINEK